MTAELVIVAVIAALALGLSAASLTVAVSARRTAGEAMRATRALAASRRRPPVEQEPRVERREEDSGPPPGTPERRRHRAPDTSDRYPRLRASADAREAADAAHDATTAIPATGRRSDDPLATREHPAPDTRFARPPPPLPPPGRIVPAGTRRPGDPQ